MIKVTALAIYPVKSMKELSLRESEVELIGFRNDRRWLVVDQNDKFQTIRECRELAQIEARPISNGLALAHPLGGSITVHTPDSSAENTTVRIWRDDVDALRANKEADKFLSDILARPVRLVYLANESARRINPKYAKPNEQVSFADGYPISIASETSWQDLRHRTGLDLSLRRFRMNIHFAGAEAWAEDRWKHIQIGDVQFRVAKPIGRCIVTTLDPDTGEQSIGNEPLATLSKIHRAADGEIIFGQHLIPDRVGKIAVGDEVKILETGSSNLI